MAHLQGPQQRLSNHQQKKTKQIQEIMQVAELPNISPENVRKLKLAYRHPFEHINPRLYTMRKSKGQAGADESKDNNNFFVENEEEYQAY